MQNNPADICRKEEIVQLEFQVGKGAIHQEQVSFTEACSFRQIPEALIRSRTLLAFNPPQLPLARVSDAARKQIVNDRIASVFRGGGPDGLDVVRDFFDWYASLSVPKPNAVLNLSAFLGQSIIAKVIRHYELREVSRIETRVPLRSLFSREEIEKFSLAEREDRSLQPDGHGWWTKNLLTLEFAGT